jgi:hypothetical protein
MLSLLLCVAFVPQGPTLIATVNDPLSHGQLGDSLLSLDEAIRFANGTLTTAQLSTAEQSRFAGTGTMIDAIVVDAMVTPTITLTAPLTDMVGPTTVHHHFEVMGMAMPGMPLPTIVGGNQPRVFTMRSINVGLHELRIQGGQVGVDAMMMHTGTPGAHMAEIMHCEFTGQTVAAVRAHGTGMAESMVMVEHTTLSNMPLGFLIEDDTAGGMVMIDGEHVEFDGVALGCRVIENGAGGNMSMFNLFRSHFANGTTLAELRRSATSAQEFMFRIVHTMADCSGTVLDCQGTAAGLSMVHHHHSDFLTIAGQKAFWCYPRTAQFDIHGSEMEFAGDVSIAANLTSPRIWQQNNRYRNGTVTIDVDGALPNLLWNHYENCAMVVPAAARSPVAVRGCQLVNTTVSSAAFLAPVTLQGCMRSGGSVTGFTTEQSPAPAMFLGTTEVTPAEPQIGAGLTLAADLPAGIGLVWDIAVSYPRPTTTMEPVRFYGDPSTVIVLPALVLFQSSMTVPIPNAPGLVGLEFYVQGISLPLLGQAHVPAYHLPRGQLVAPRL